MMLVVGIVSFQLAQPIFELCNHVQFLAVSTPLRKGRGSVSVGRLASNALDPCHRARRRNEASCDCQEIDRNGRNVLQPTDDFVRRFQ